MIDVELLMQKVEKQALESGIELCSIYARAYCKWDTEADKPQWVICEPAEVGVRTEPHVVSREQAAELLRRVSQGLIPR